MRQRAVRGNARFARTWKGGEMPTIPWSVDFKKGFELLTDKRMWSIPKKPSKEEMTLQKERIQKMKAKYKMYKDAGGSKSYKQWGVQKRLFEKPTFTFPGFGW